MISVGPLSSLQCSQCGCNITTLSCHVVIILWIIGEFIDKNSFLVVLPSLNDAKSQTQPSPDLQQVVHVKRTNRTVMSTIRRFKCSYCGIAFKFKDHFKVWQEHSHVHILNPNIAGASEGPRRRRQYPSSVGSAIKDFPIPGVTPLTWPARNARCQVSSLEIKINCIPREERGRLKQI